jgi:hypothetical protein
MSKSRPRPNWSRPLPRRHTGLPFGARDPRRLGIYLASAFFFNEPRVNAVAVCAVILFTIEGTPPQDVSTVQPEETRSAQGEDTQLPAAPLDDPVSTSSNGHLSGTAGQPLCVRRDALAEAQSRACLAIIKRKRPRSVARQLLRTLRTSFYNAFRADFSFCKSSR